MRHIETCYTACLCTSVSIARVTQEPTGQFQELLTEKCVPTGSMYCLSRKQALVLGEILLVLSLSEGSNAFSFLCVYSKSIQKLNTKPQKQRRNSDIYYFTSYSAKSQIPPVIWLNTPKIPLYPITFHPVWQVHKNSQDHIFLLNHHNCGNTKLKVPLRDDLHSSTSSTRARHKR